MLVRNMKSVTGVVSVATKLLHRIWKTLNMLLLRVKPGLIYMVVT